MTDATTNLEKLARDSITMFDALRMGKRLKPNEIEHLSYSMRRIPDILRYLAEHREEFRAFVEARKAGKR